MVRRGRSSWSLISSVEWPRKASDFDLLGGVGLFRAPLQNDGGPGAAYLHRPQSQEKLLEGATGVFVRLGKWSA